MSVVIHTMPLASGASHTNAIDLGKGEFVGGMIEFPGTSPLSGAGDITAEVSRDGTTWREVCYSNAPGGSSSGLVKWSASQSSFGKAVFCEAMVFARGYFRLKFGATATAATNFYLYTKSER